MPLEKSRESQEAVLVALYIRTLPGDPDNFLQAQLTALQRYDRRRRLDAARVFFDIQGGRSQFEAMLAEATRENPPFRRVLVHDEGRLCGREAELQELRARLEGHGVRVMSSGRAVSRNGPSRPGMCQEEEPPRKPDGAERSRPRQL